MRASFPCPHCTRPVDDKFVDRRWSRKSFCPHCNAPIRFHWLEDLGGFFAGLAAAMLAGLATRPLWIEFYEGVHPLGKNDVRLLPVVIPFLVIWALVERAVHARFGSLVIANPAWQFKPSSEERALMREHGIRWSGEYFSCGDMDFDTLQQAVEHARSQQPREQKESA